VVELGAVLAAVIAAAASGFFGAWWGTRTQIRHDRIERLRGRRTDAAAALIKAWTDALFAVDQLYERVDEGETAPAELLAPASDAITEAVKHQTLFELLFDPDSPATTSSTLLRHTLRNEVDLLGKGFVNEARYNHLNEASPHMDSLIRHASSAIARTGSADDPLEPSRPNRPRLPRGE
jgi:hypothetical protein